MTGNEVNDLPEVTFAKRMALQANLISKYQIANEIINESNSENTLQFDGTSKWGEHFFTFDISTPERSFTGSINSHLKIKVPYMFFLFLCKTLCFPLFVF
jgi:N-methylhydantoinase B/oxoprolinase/acetone carboxylase alpha subunit